MEKFSSIINALFDRTMANSLTWEESNWPDAYEVSFAKSSVRLRQLKNGPEFDYTCSIINSSGDVVDSFSDNDLHQAGFNYRDKNAYQVMGQIYDVAKRQVSGADQVLDEVMRELGIKR